MLNRSIPPERKRILNHKGHSEPHDLGYILKSTLEDLETLFDQHLRLSRLILKIHLKMAIEVGITMIVSLILLSIGLSSLIQSFVNSASTQLALSQDSLNALVGGLAIAATIGLFWYAIRRLRKLSQLPEQMIKPWQKEWQWIRNHL